MIHTEDKRQLVHITLGFCAFLFVFLSRSQVLSLLSALLVFTVVIIPYSPLRRHLYRHYERRYSRGALSYFLSLIILSLFAPLFVVAGSWVVLAFGDGAATLIGKHTRSLPLSWNKHKSLVGTLSFIVIGSVALCALLYNMLPGIALFQAVILSIITTGVAAFFESLPWKIDDNISVVIASAIVLSLTLIR